MIIVGLGANDSNYFYTNNKYTNGRLTRVQTNGSETESSAATDNATYEYYPDGKLKKITYPKLNDNTLLTAEYVYNALGRLTSMVNKKDSTVLSKFSYTYDANGNILSINDGKTTKTYVYDKLNRLIEILPEDGNKTVYSYDLRGNRLTESSDRFDFDLVDTSYTYDIENRLKSVIKGTETTNMEYYVDGLRSEKSTASSSTLYVYDLADHLIAEAKDSSTITTNYVWGPDRVLVKKEAGGGEYYYLYNGHGDVVQMVDRNGNVVNNYQYDEWGNIEVNNETISNPFKYTGEVYDQETGLYYLRARYYDPTVGRFLNEDSVEGQVNNPLSLNLYTYCYNNPIHYSDPTGNTPYTAKELYSIDGKSTYGYFWSGRGSDGVSLFISYVPFMGTVQSLSMKTVGFKEIKSSAAKGLMGVLQNIKDSDSTSISLDVLSTLEDLSDVGKLSKVMRIGGKYIGKAASYIGTGFTIYDTGKFFTDNGYVADQIIEWTPIGSRMYATTREGVEQKYLYASMAIKKLISAGKITYETDSYGNVTDVHYPQNYINDINRVLKEIDIQRGESARFINHLYQ